MSLLISHFSKICTVSIVLILCKSSFRPCSSMCQYSELLSKHYCVEGLRAILVFEASLKVSKAPMIKDVWTVYVWTTVFLTTEVKPLMYGLLMTVSHTFGLLVYCDFLTEKQQKRFWYQTDGLTEWVASRGASTEDLIIFVFSPDPPYFIPLIISLTMTLWWYLWYSLELWQRSSQGVTGGGIAMQSPIMSSEPASQCMDGKCSKTITNCNSFESKLRALLPGAWGKQQPGSVSRQDTSDRNKSASSHSPPLSNERIGWQ